LTFFTFNTTLTIWASVSWHFGTLQLCLWYLILSLMFDLLEAEGFILHLNTLYVVCRAFWVYLSMPIMHEP
jgi:hypothetical protein